MVKDYKPNEYPTVIVIPLPLINQWAEQLEEKTDFRALIYQGDVVAEMTGPKRRNLKWF